MSLHKAVGPGEQHSKALPALAPFIAEPHTKLFNLSQLTTEVPEDWRIAIIRLIFKKGKRKAKANYRSSGLMSIIYKLKKSAIEEAKIGFLLRTAALSDTQNDFVLRRSCLPNLLFTEQGIALLRIINFPRHIFE